MNQPSPSFLLPKPISALLARLPSYPGSVLLVAALNAGVARQLPPDVGERLLHKRFRIDVRDARATFDFTWSDNWHPLWRGSLGVRIWTDSPSSRRSSHSR